MGRQPAKLLKYTKLGGGYDYVFIIFTPARGDDPVWLIF